MCGIFGYSGQKQAKEVIINGLKRLEYRGYDSWGVAVDSDHEIFLDKDIGKIDIDNELKLPQSNLGIGHTRWATHGGVTQINAHPHYSTDKSFVLAQNGIVQNYQELKEKLLESDYEFQSETDTEVIVRLIELKQKESDSLFDAVLKAFKDLTGRNTIILLDSKTDEIIAARNGSPLIIGLNSKTKEIFFSSDTLSFGPFATKMYVMENNQIAYLQNGNIKVFDIKSEKEIEFEWEDLDLINDKVDKEGFDHFMIKEIVEQKATLRDVVSYSYDDLKPLIEKIKSSNTVYTLACGGASFAAAQMAYFLRKIAGVKAIELRGYECDSYYDLFTDKDLIIAISQSGESADTIEPLEIAKSKGTQIASLVNMSGSTVTRMSDYKYFTKSGPEICVASTKTFTAQVAFGILLSYSLVGKFEEAKKNITSLAESLEEYMNTDLFTKLQRLAEKLKDKEHFYVLGRGQNYTMSLEGALKFKEISNIHAESFAGGELKHGPIALIEKDSPVFLLISEDDSRDDMISAAAQVKARGAYVIGVGQVSAPIFDEYIATLDNYVASSIANVIPFQLLSYYLAVILKHDPDKPRNLAKSVTVK